MNSKQWKTLIKIKTWYLSGPGWNNETWEKSKEQCSLGVGCHKNMSSADDEDKWKWSDGRAWHFNSCVYWKTKVRTTVQIRSLRQCWTTISGRSKKTEKV